jgi:hypothetical protein
MAWADEAVMGDHGPVIGVSFYSTALLNAVLFRAPFNFAQNLADKTKAHIDGWRGLVGHFGVLFIPSLHILAYDVEDDDILRETNEALASFPSSEHIFSVCPDILSFFV